MKKLLSYFCAAVLAVSTLSACGNTASDNAVMESEGALASADISDNEVAKGNADSKSIQIVTTIFPEYDWVKEILGANPAEAEITMLLDNGVDLHSYQPTAEDIMKISICDLFIYVGGESDEWVDDALKEAVNPDMKVLNLLEILGTDVKEEEIVEGMEAEDEHDHEHEDGDGHEHEEGEEHEDGDGHEHEEGEVEYDEHVWLSLDKAEKICEAIKDALVEIDAGNKDVYEANAKSYEEKLEELDEKFEAVVSSASKKTLLFGDRFPFRYFVDDYDLSYYAAFVGCSAETEASFETITFLAGKVDELGLTSIMTIESSDKKIAETIKSNTKDKDQKILTMDSMQSTTSKDVEGGATYLSIMESNLEVLKEALN